MQGTLRSDIPDVKRGAGRYAGLPEALPEKGMGDTT